MKFTKITDVFFYVCIPNGKKSLPEFLTNKI